MTVADEVARKREDWEWAEEIYIKGSEQAMVPHLFFGTIAIAVTENLSAMSVLPSRVLLTRVCVSPT